MQLFGLVNNLLENDSETSKSLLNIGCYAVIPLSPNSGLIGWVPHSDTFHVLIRDYRDARQIVLNMEHRLMMQMAPHLDTLTLPQKVEVFEYALDTTDGQDLERVLWLKSATSEIWLERRTMYTRSVAVMSMVGYILGLGDRHPSNLMLDRSSGQVVHIDFGDCFEVAMQREKFPEKIPFRLTRMLVNAMEISGIEGSYRFTCEKVMRVLRENKDSLMAVLEAFVYDPLINWRLLTPPKAQQPKPQTPPPQGDALHSPGLQQQANGGTPFITSAEELLTAEFNTSGDKHKQDVSFHAASASSFAADVDDHIAEHDQLNERALTVIKRVSKKLTGLDFGSTVLDVRQQVNNLINQATSHENLCQCYVGWCPFW